MISGIWFSLINDVTKISSLFPTATIWLGGSALTDVLITTSLVYHVSFLAYLRRFFSLMAALFTAP